MRKAFLKALCEEAEKDKRIFLLTGDLGYTILEPFRDRFPARFLNVGVAESNLMTVAAGLASTGFIPVAYSIATFAVYRPYEQIRNDIGLQHMNVKIVAVGAGFAYSHAGPTHHALSDIAVMQSVYGMKIISPANQDESYKATKAMLKSNGPAYLRIERNPPLFDFPLANLSLDKIAQIKKGENIAIIALGPQIYAAIEVAKILNEKHIDPALFSIQSFSADTKVIKEIAKNFEHIVTIEEHSKRGGLGSMVAEHMSAVARSRAQLHMFGADPNVIVPTGSYDYLMKKHRMTPQEIASAILKKTTRS